jgi:hypothetical protein
VPPERLEEILLGEVGVEEPVGPGALPLLPGLLAAADENDRPLRRLLVGLQHAADVDAGHPLHLGVQEDEVRLFAAGHRQRVRAVRGRQDTAVGAALDRARDLAEEAPIVHEENGAHDDPPIIRTSRDSRDDPAGYTTRGRRTISP